MRAIDCQCPICKAPNTWKKENLFRPFCSQRCKLIDFGAWADGKYSVPAEHEEVDTLSVFQEEQQ